MNFLNLLPVYALFVLAIVSPGPDFLMVTRQSLTHGRIAGIYCSLGIAAGISVHIGYCLLGLGLIIAQSLVLFSLIKVVSGIYLIYLGWHAIKSAHATPTSDPALAITGDLLNAKHCLNKQDKIKAFRQGFFTNLLNPKAALFFVSLFSIVLHDGVAWGQTLLLVFMMVATAFGFFSMLATGLNHGPVQRLFHRWRRWLDRVTGALLILLGLKIVSMSHA
jgi:RhtB (resistance to homoserine/threonine) family protein